MRAELAPGASHPAARCILVSWRSLAAAGSEVAALVDSAGHTLAGDSDVNIGDGCQAGRKQDRGLPLRNVGCLIPALHSAKPHIWSDNDQLPLCLSPGCRNWLTAVHFQMAAASRSAVCKRCTSSRCQRAHALPRPSSRIQPSLRSQDPLARKAPSQRTRQKKTRTVVIMSRKVGSQRCSTLVPVSADRPPCFPSVLSWP
jgi:hypothetical protein